MCARTRSPRRWLVSCALALALAPSVHAQDFVRGRVNADDKIDVADAVYVLSYLFVQGPAPACQKAADANDDGRLDISDAVKLLVHLFATTGPLPLPFPTPGPDPTPDSLTCGGNALTALALTPTPVSLTSIGQTQQLTATGTRGGASVDVTAGSSGTTYESSNTAVAFVYRDGLLEAKSTGTATITARNSGLEAQASVTVTIGVFPGTYVVLGANDLGMHCIDREFSVYSILPPFNVVRAQVVRRVAGGSPQLMSDSLIKVAYSPVADAKGSINSTSPGKTIFWDYVAQIFGMAVPKGQGLLGFFMPQDAPTAGPQPLSYVSALRTFAIEGVPIVDKDDAGAENPYPLLRVTASNKTTGAYLAHLDIVAPVSPETDCQNCHATGQQAAKDPGIEWFTDADKELQTKKNVLLLHDTKNGTSLLTEQPVLCARCHFSPALDLAGAGPQGEQLSHALFSQVMHGYHGNLLDFEGEPVFPPSGDALSTCYQCHPGRVTKCLRGPMATAGMECRNCHGDMRATGGEFPLAAGGSMDGTNDGKSRRPWLDLPRCQSCHTGDAVSHLTGANLVMAPDGIRLTQGYRTGDQSASPLLATNKRFAENTNTRFRVSAGHGGILCEHCHGSTHAEYPNADPNANDNVAANHLQKHTGKIMECSVCHADGTLGRTNAGPHGLHNVNDPTWYADGHEDFWERDAQSCRACHGATLDGTPLSRTPVARRFTVEEGKVVTIAAGTNVGCTHCHGKP